MWSIEGALSRYSAILCQLCGRKWQQGDSRPRRRPTRRRPLPHFFSPVSSFAINRRCGISQLPLQNHSSLGRTQWFTLAPFACKGRWRNFHVLGPCLQSSISTLSFSLFALFFCYAVSSCVYDHNHPCLVSERLFLAENKAFPYLRREIGAMWLFFMLLKSAILFDLYLLTYITCAIETPCDANLFYHLSPYIFSIAGAIFKRRICDWKNLNNHWGWCECRYSGIRQKCDFFWTTFLLLPIIIGFGSLKRFWGKV